jgi:hypothetical protein
MELTRARGGASGNQTGLLFASFQAYARYREPGRIADGSEEFGSAGLR